MPISVHLLFNLQDFGNNFQSYKHIYFATEALQQNEEIIARMAAAHQ